MRVDNRLDAEGTPGRATVADAGFGQQSAGEELAHGTVPLAGVMAQAVGIMAPTATMALAIGFIAATAGDGSWLAWLLVTLGVGACAYAIAWLARRHVSTGGLYGLTAQAGGSAGGWFGGVTMIIGQTVAGPALVIGGGIFMGAFLHRLGVADSKGIVVLGLVLATLYAAGLAHLDVRMSARVLLVMETITVTLVVVLLAISVFQSPGPIFDSSQLGLHGVSAHLLFLSFGFAVYSLAGFDSASVLGREARDPRRAIPMAVVGSVVLCGVFYCVASYIMVRGFAHIHGTTLATNPAPLDGLADSVGVSGFGYVIDLGVAVSFFSCALAAMNASARYFYTLARDGLAPQPLARTHPTRKTPTAAIGLVAIVWLLIALIPILTSRTPALDIYGYLGTASGYAFTVAYAGAALITLVRARRDQGSKAVTMTASAVGVLAMIIALYNSFHPFPQGAYGTVAWLSIAGAAVLVILYAVLRVARPTVLDRIRQTSRVQAH